ncbi:efflux RND transporter permease subunit [uncultured Ilyobacter sp.]|uniref:efflux RND transporter permease subunit n=1 Tax=uncultured Ilyobacter sp. TaxID=544433 RepID=UPI0029C698C8|nr:efflux RND transporter permease subunit [uncultured Ilyobacter sp.]
MDITNFSIKNRATIIILYVLVVFAGINTFKNMQKGEDPPFTIKTSTITTQWPGATAEQMAELVGDKVEEVVQDIEELDFVETKNSPGLSTTYVNIRPEYRDLQPIWDNLRKKVKYNLEPYLPSGTTVPNVNDEFGDVFGSVIMVTGDGYTYHELAVIAEELREHILKKVPEAGKVHVYGNQQEKVYLNFDPAKLAQLGITSSDIKNALMGRNKVSSSGNIVIGNDKMTLNTSGDFKSIEEIGDTVINKPGSIGIVYLKDIAEIKRGYVNPANYLTRFNGKESIGVAVSLKDGMDDIKLGEHLKEYVTTLENKYPIGVNFDFVAYSSQRVEDKINSFVSNLAQAIVTVLIVMLISLGLRTGLIVASLIPTSIAMAFIIMPHYGVNLDQMSLAGLIIALGMLVDNAIVMSESIMVAMEKGKSRLEACLGSAQQLKIPLLMSSLTTVAAFTPIFLIEESMGEYVGPMAKVVVFTLLSSWLVAMTLVPLLCFIFLKVDHKEHEYKSLTYTSYRKILLFALKHKVITIIFAVGMFSMGIFLFRFTGNEFMPESDQKIMLTTLRLPKGSSIEATEKAAKDLDEYIRENLQVPDKQLKVGFFKDIISGFTIREYEKDGILNWGTFIGGGAPRFVLAYSPEASSAEYAYVIYNSTTHTIIPKMSEKIDSYMKDLYPDLDISTKKMKTGPSSDRDVEYRLSADNLEELFEKIEIVQSKLSSVPIAKNVTNSWKNQVKKLTLNIDQERVRKAGLTTEDVSNSMAVNLEGLAIGTYREPNSPLTDKSIPIVLRTNDAHNTVFSKLDTMKIYSSPTGKFVPLSQVADIKMDFERGYIHKRDRIYTIAVQADAIGGHTSNEIDKIMSPWIVEKVKEWEAQKDEEVKVKTIAGIPARAEGGNYKYEIGGSSEMSNKQSNALGEKLPYAGLFILLLLVAQFNSIRKPIIILLTIPLGILGVAVGLIVGNQNFGFFAIIGLVSLSGVVVNNAIVLLDQIDIEINENCLEPAHAVVMSAQGRFRPIILTTLTTLCGLIPLWIFGGNMWKPMAVSLIFGLIFATILTLGVIPVLYTIFFGVSYKEYEYEKLSPGLQSLSR